MNETARELYDYARLFWEKRWYVFGVASLVCALGWPVAMLLPNSYEVSSKVYLDTQSMLTPLLRGLAVDSDATLEFVNVARRTLLSRPNLVQVARETDLDLQAETPEEMEVLLQELQKDILVSGSGRDHIYQILYENKDPQLAKRVVESLLNIFMEGALTAGRQDTDDSQRFIEEQILIYQERLEAAELRLQKFKQTHVGKMPDEAGDYFSRLAQVRVESKDAELQLSEARERRLALKRQLVILNREMAQGGVSAAVEGYSNESLDARIESLEARLDELLLLYTERHPDVVSAKSSLGELRLKRDIERKEFLEEQSLMPKNSITPQVRNPAIFDLQFELGKAEALVASLAVRHREYQKRVNELKNLINTIPEVEAELAKLNRDYLVNKTNYDALVTRRESAKISHDAERSTDQIQFNVIEPPLVPILPSGPNRIALYSAVYFLALAAGLGFAYLLSMMSPVVTSVKQLRGLTGLPVLGGVGYVYTPEQLTKRKIALVGYLFAQLALFVVFLGLLVSVLI